MAETGRKAIFISGGAAGIGRAVALHFAERGWFVGLGDIDEAGLAATAAMLPAGAGSCHRLDVRDRAAWDAALADFLAVAGRLDVLFNNAGVAHGGPFVEQSEDEIERLLAINLRGVINGARAGYPHLRATPGSCLLNTCSASGIYGSPGLAVYSATKFAVRALTEALDLEWAADRIKVRDIMPGFVDTALLAGPTGRSNKSMRQRVVATGMKFTPVEEVARQAWRAVHRAPLHTPVGKTARGMWFAARWMPARLRAQLRRIVAGKQAQSARKGANGPSREGAIS